MKRVLAGILTILLMGLLAWSGLRRPPVASSEPVEATGEGTNPAELCVRNLLDRAGNGDVAGYLEAFDGPLRSRLERDIAERGRDAFAADLRKASQARKSHALFAAEAEGDATSRVVVETVYPDRNERQTYRIDRTPAGWRVTEVETLRTHQPRAKFGDQADYQAPEGVPIQMVPDRGKPAAEGLDDSEDR